MFKKCFALASIIILASAFCGDMKTFKPQKGVEVVEIKNANITPYVSDSLARIEDAFDVVKPRVMINAGFFDPKTHETISYIVKDKVLVANPEDNDNLMANRSIQPYLRRVLDRSEFRVLSCDDKIKYDITNHLDAVPQGCAIVDSIQAGPMLWPHYKAEEEAFIIKQDGKVLHEGAEALSHHARSAIGFKGDKVYLIAVSNKNPMTLDELAAFVKKLKLDKAMALDGGSSTSLMTDINGKKTRIIANKNDVSRRVKSFWYVK